MQDWSPQLSQIFYELILIKKIKVECQTTRGKTAMQTEKGHADLRKDKEKEPLGGTGEHPRR